MADVSATCQWYKGTRATQGASYAHPSLIPIPPILHPLTLFGPPRKTRSGRAVLPDADKGIEMVVKDERE